MIIDFISIDLEVSTGIRAIDRAASDAKAAILAAAAMHKGSADASIASSDTDVALSEVEAVVDAAIAVVEAKEAKRKASIAAAAELLSAAEADDDDLLPHAV